MKRARIGMMAIVALSVATVAFAQAKPDFSGTWAPEPPAGAAAGGAPGGAPGGGGGGGGRGGGGPMTVKQTATELSIERQGRNGGPAQTTTYKLDGTPSTITMGQGQATATAKWDGNKLVISTKSDNGEQTQTWSLANGVLTVDRTGGRGPSTTTYKKST
jgi:hypothetical protein